MSLGWTVLRWNQASGLPSLEIDELHDTKDAAESVASEAHEINRTYGRREQFTVAEVFGDPPGGAA